MLGIDRGRYLYLFSPKKISSNHLITGNQKLDKHDVSFPSIVTDAGSSAEYAYREFFDAGIENDYTRKAYRQAVLRFLVRCDAEGLSLQQIAPWHVSEHIKTLTNLRNGKEAATRTRKLHLTAIREFFNVQVVRHAVVLNPALSVKSPRLKQREGATPAIAPDHVKHLFAAIDIGDESKPNIIGLRDNAILRVLAYTGARSGAVAKLRLRDYFSDGEQWYLRLREKNGKVENIPVRHDLQQAIDAYVEVSGIGTDDRDSPLFRACNGRSSVLSERPLRCETVLMMFKRRLRGAGISTDVLTGHSFRAAVATDLLKQGIPLEDVQKLLLHSDPRTTQGYDRSQRKVTRNIVERISH